MKLRNKKTGEIVEPFGITCVNGRTFVQFDDEKGTFKFEAHSLAEINAEWEDYEEPKVHWYIYGVEPLEIEEGNWNKDFVDELKSIGNYFKTKEEAEKAVEKLKAWKKLKDNGFKLKGWYMPKNIFKIEIDGGFSEDVSLCDFMDDLDKVFGGEE